MWAGLLSFSLPARAFEKQWHFGGGLGAALAAERSLGPALNLYGAYGISDVFDVRLEAFASWNLGPNSTSPLPEVFSVAHGGFFTAGGGPPSSALFYGGKLALAYKFDVIEWIPYFGVSAGFLGVAPRAEFEGQVDTATPFANANFSAGLLFGLDYALSRSFGLGLAVFGDYAFHADALYGAGFLRAEYRLGW